MTFRKAIAWLLLLAMLLVQPASVFSDSALGTTCSHRWSGWDPIEYPTCTTTGKQIRFCSICLTQQIETIPKLPHNWNEWTVTKAPTCTSTGSRFHVCSVCGTRETETMDKAPHKYGAWVDIVPATCTSKGSHYRICEICGYKQTLDSNPLPHTWGEWEVTKEANCSERGEETHTCLVCGTSETRTTKVNGTRHAWGDWIVRMEPDCEKGGYRSHGCTKCNKWESEKTPPLGHDWGEWTVITPAAPGVPGVRQHQCTRCKATEKESFDYVGEPGLQLTCSGITPLGTQDGFESVYQADMVLENTGELSLQFELDSTYTNGNEVLTDTYVGWDGTTGTLEPGQAFAFKYLIRTSADDPESADKMIERYVYAGGWSPETGKRTSVNTPLFLRMPQKTGLILTVVNVHRSGEGKDEVITFDLTVTNHATDWSLVTLSAASENGELTPGEGFIDVPEDGLLLGYNQTAAFSYRAIPGQADADASKDTPYIDVSRWISAKDSYGNAASIQLSALVDIKDIADAHLEGSLDMQGRDRLYEQDPVSLPGSYTLTNTGVFEITDPVLKASLVTSSGKLLHTYTLLPVSGTSSLKPTESTTFEMNLDITAEDEQAVIGTEDLTGFCGLRLLCCAEYDYTGAEGPAYGESNLLVQSVEVWELGPDDPKNTYILPVLNGTFEDRTYHTGETVWFDLMVTNINPTDTITGIRFDWFPYKDNGDLEETPVEIDMSDVTLKPGESYTLEHQFSYTVTQAAAERGYTVMDFVAWCHSSTHDWWANCGWQGLVHTEPGAEGGLSIKASYGPYSYYPMKKLEWEPVNKTETELPGLDLSNITTPASLTIFNESSETLDVLIASDHPADQIGGESEKTISLPAGGMEQIDYVIAANPDEIKAGKLERTVTASTPDGSQSDTGHVSMSLYSGEWKPDTENPALYVTCGSIVPAWNDTLKTAQYRISVCVRNVGNRALTLYVESVELNNTTVTTDTFEGWAEAPNKLDFKPGDDLYFTYVINETDNDRFHDFIHRTLNVGGFVITSNGYVADSLTFSFPTYHECALDLAAEAYHRLGGPGQPIDVDLSLNNRGEISLHNIQLSSLDEYGKEPQADSLNPNSLPFLAPNHKTYGLLYKIYPTPEEINKGEVIRVVTATAEPDGITDTVYLHYLLNSDKKESEILHLEGTMQSLPVLGLNDLFEADISATNAGNVDLEDIVIQLVVQSADGNALLKTTFGAAGQGTVYGPGKGVQCFPKIEINKQMLAAALSAQCLNNGCDAKTLTFTFTGQYTRRHSDSWILPGVSNSVSFTVGLEGGTGGISVRQNLSIPVPSPKEGETLYVPLIVENIGKEDLIGLELDVSKLAINTFVPIAALIYKPFDIIHPGETIPYTYEYTVTKEDVEKGNAGFLFTASSGSTTQNLLYVDSYEYNKALFPEPEKHLVLRKSVTNTPPGGQTAFRLSDEIDYLITVINETGEDLEDVRVYDDVTGYASPVLVGMISLKAGETTSVPFHRVVCPLDVAQLQVENQAYATYALSTDPMLRTDYSNFVTTPVEETPEEREIVTVEKKLNNSSLDPKGYALDETIDYLITVTSKHKESVVVDVWDDVWGSEAPEMVASITLYPGETRSFSHSYKVREVDLPPTPDLIGSVINEAYANVLIYDDGATIISGYTSWAPPVEAPTIRTAPVDDEEQPTPKTPAATPAPKAGPSDSCRRVLTGYGSCGAEYDLLFCLKHNTLETITRNLSAAEAVTVWEEAVSAGYDSLAEKMSPETTALLRIEQTLFAQQLDSWYTMIAGQFGTEKAETFRLQQLRERCLDLCYAAHHASAQRTDSILQSGIPVLSARGERASLCGKTTEAIPGGYHITETVCRTHDFITSTLKLKLTAAASAGEKADAFDDSRQLWISILMKDANELYQGMSPENQASLSAGLNFFQGWLNARMNVLRALYPADPAAASEVLAETVHSRMLDLENLIHE
ncbi:MAG: hypothetical protein IJL88_01270 [Clostridia bacterium]|nr:hypothetical protein [Clostridia bacterium]